MSDDERWMKRALRLAVKGEGRTSPNPMVGAVVVAGDREVAGGWYRGPGTPHAEVAALEGSGSRARGATVYVSLEPCVHHGRTPPCTEALIAAGAARVVAAVEDPDALVSGRGFARLKSSGIEVTSGILEAEARKLNEAYFVHRKLGRPFVTYKAAISLDGRTAAGDGTSRWITGEVARRDAHRLRAKSDAICVGISTVLTDDPSLTVRGVRSRTTPLRVVVDSSARTPKDAKVVSAEAPTLIAVTQSAPPERMSMLEAAGAQVEVLPAGEGGVSVKALVTRLAERGIVSLLLEGGGTLGGAFASAGVIDRYVVYLAPKLIGGEGTTGLLEGWAAGTISEARQLEIESARRLGEDLVIVARPRTKVH